MARTPNKYAEQFRELDQLRAITEQEGKVAQFARAKAGLSVFGDASSAARAAFLVGERGLSVEDKKFRQLVRACEDLLLVTVAEATRDPLRREATQSALHMADEWRSRLGDIEILAIADIQLRGTRSRARNCPKPVAPATTRPTSSSCSI